RCKVLATKENISLLELQLITGRTHQIRVHLKYKGTPILGDPVYGSPSANQKFGVNVQQLHAHRICFSHPITQNILNVHAPMPYEMRRFLE
ncbi:MAG TPA: pseudouridine synthase, partial [Rhabdochlamydiaceae bacterium]